MQTKDLTQGSVWSNILTFSLPYMLAYFLQVLYGLADLFIIGTFGHVSDTTAVSNGTQVMNLITVVIIGLAMGATVNIAHAVGAGDKKRMGRIIGNTFCMFGLFALMLTAVLLLCCQYIVAWVSPPAEATAGMKSYLMVCFAGVPAIMAYNVIASVFRGMGDSRTPMYLVAVACLANIGLDYVFIGILGYGPIGAALGTTLSQTLSVAIAAFTIWRHRKGLYLQPQCFRLYGRTIRSILQVGLPISLQDGFIQVSFLVIMVIANMRGLNDAAAVGIVEKFIGLLFIVPSSMLSTVSAISAQSIGAGKKGRAQHTMHEAIGITFAFGTLMAVVFQFIPERAVGLFTQDAQVVLSGSQYLRSYVIDCALAGIHFCYSGYFTACGRSILPFAHNVASIILVRIPFTYVLSEAFPHTLYPMGFASPAGSLLSVVICVGAYAWLKRKGKA